MAKSIIIGQELTKASLRVYDKHILKNVFVAPKKARVLEVVADGHSKVHVACANAKRHAGKPRPDRLPKTYSHGWFMVVNPTDQRILWAKPMYEPKGNAVLEEAISEILPSYKNLDGVVVDRACAFRPRASTLKKLKQIKFWAVDGFRAHGHTKTCKCNPRFQKRLATRFRNTNTSAAEQVFSWFCNYSRILNEAGPLRHSFKVLLFCKKHNEAVEKKSTGYLSARGRNRKMISKPYSCKKKPASRR